MRTRRDRACTLVARSWRHFLHGSGSSSLIVIGGAVRELELAPLLCCFKAMNLLRSSSSSSELELDRTLGSPESQGSTDALLRIVQAGAWVLSAARRWSITAVLGSSG